MGLNELNGHACGGYCVKLETRWIRLTDSPQNLTLRMKYMKKWLIIEKILSHLASCYAHFNVKMLIPTI